MSKKTLKPKLNQKTNNLQVCVHKFRLIQDEHSSIYNSVNLCSGYVFNINFKLKYVGESINIDDEILEYFDTHKFGKK